MTLYACIRIKLIDISLQCHAIDIVRACIRRINYLMIKRRRIRKSSELESNIDRDNRLRYIS